MISLLEGMAGSIVEEGKAGAEGAEGKATQWEKILMISFIMLMIDQSVMTMNINDKYYGMLILEPHINSDKRETFGCKDWMQDVQMDKL